MSEQFFFFFKNEKGPVNGTNERFVDPPKPIKGYSNNLHYSINELIVNTNRSGNQDVIKGNVKR